MKNQWCFMPSRPSLVLITSLMVLTFLVFFFTSPEDIFFSQEASKPIDYFREHEGLNISKRNFSTPNDKLLGGLLSPNFDGQSCLSRYQSVLFRKLSPHIPSPYLVSKLRKYEILHRKCGPNTSLFNKAIKQLNADYSTDLLECNYLLWTPRGGLGNRMLSLASTFLYALLTDRVLLLDPTTDFVDLFCEPFPNSSWVLPSNFIIKELDGYDISSQRSYGYMLENNLISTDPQTAATALPSFVFIHLDSNYIKGSHLHKLFFCEDSQSVLRKINWLVIKSDVYFLPGLFMISQYNDELNRMFPLKDTVFHHLGRYLYHPSNSVWRMSTGYYSAYLSNAKEIVGIQVRDFDWAPISTKNRFEQIMDCTLKNNILPQNTCSATNGESSRAILLVSLKGDYYDKMISYCECPNVNTTSEFIGVYQPSHEGYQRTKRHSHNEKALAEIFLLSFCDVFVTTAMSTFGYVGYNLAGIKPWFLFVPQNGKIPDPTCSRAVTIEPCFHTPPNFDCKALHGADTGKMVQYVRHCEDFRDGVKLFD